MVVDGGAPITGRSEGRFLGLDLVEFMYLGGVPDFNEIHPQTGFTTGFLGCISRLVIGTSVTVDLMRDAKEKVRTHFTLYCITVQHMVIFILFYGIRFCCNVNEDHGNGIWYYSKIIKMHIWQCSYHSCFLFFIIH